MKNPTPRTVESGAISPTKADEKRGQSMKRKGVLSTQLLRRENRQFSNTNGVSERNHNRGFVPAFLDTRSGISVVSRYADGRPAPIHILDGLPAAWITAFNSKGQVTAVREGVIAGFIHSGRVYTREEAARVG